MTTLLNICGSTLFQRVRWSPRELVTILWRALNLRVDTVDWTVYPLGCQCREWSIGVLCLSTCVAKRDCYDLQNWRFSRHVVSFLDIRSCNNKAWDTWNLWARIVKLDRALSSCQLWVDGYLGSTAPETIFFRHAFHFTLLSSQSWLGSNCPLSRF